MCPHCLGNCDLGPGPPEPLGRGVAPRGEVGLVLLLPHRAEGQEGGPGGQLLRSDHPLFSVVLWTQTQCPRGHGIPQSCQEKSPEKCLGRARACCLSPWFSTWLEGGGGGQSCSSEKGCCQPCGPALPDLSPTDEGGMTEALHADPITGPGDYTYLMPVAGQWSPCHLQEKGQDVKARKNRKQPSPQSRRPSPSQPEPDLSSGPY